MVALLRLPSILPGMDVNTLGAIAIIIVILFAAAAVFLDWRRHSA